MRSKFYDRLKELRDYHRRYSASELTEAPNEDALLREEPPLEFSGEECLGRCLDLIEHHQRYVNAKWGKQCDYSQYLADLAAGAAPPQGAPTSSDYRDYLKRLFEYLASFYRRTQPLALLDRQLARTEEEVAAAGPGAERLAAGEQASAGDGTPLIDLEAFESPEELETVGALPACARPRLNRYQLQLS